MGQLLQIVGPREALRLTKSAGCKPIGKPPRLIRAIEVPAIGDPIKPASPSRLSMFAGQRYTYRAKLGSADQIAGSCIEFRKIESEDQPLFLLAITDCLREA